LGSLARGSELTVIRATGISIVRLAGAALIAGLILMSIEVLLGEYLSPPLQVAAREQKAFAKYTDVSFGGGGGAWVRDGNLILNVARQSGQRRFGSMQIFELTPEHHLVALGHAESATAGSDKKWLLGEYTESRFSDDSVQAQAHGTRVLQSNVTVGFLGLAARDPNTLTNRALWQLIQYSRLNSLDTSRYVFAFWSRIARTVAIPFAVLLTIPFVLGSLRSSGAGTRTLIGLLLGICLFLVEKLIESGAVVFDLNPLVLAWIPTALLGLVTLVLLARAR
jgi:lipopolysaccharide export system permease protein